MKLRTVIVEDELPSLNRLQELLAEIENIELVGSACDGERAVQLINEVKPDLAFLDVQLPVFTSFEVLHRLSHRPSIILVTAYDQYAIQAFEENAVDYLLKPTSPERLRKAIARVTRIKRHFDRELLEALQSALEKKQYLHRFSVKIGDEILFVPAHDVYYFHAEEKYVFVNTFNQEHIIDLTLKALETGLDPGEFLRIHKSVIVAIDKINRVKRSLVGKFKVQLNNSAKSSFEIGRGFLSSVRERLNF